MIFFLAHELFILMYLFLCDVYVRRRHYVFIFVSCFTCATLAIDLYYKVIHDICLYFLFCEINNLFCSYIFHTCVYVFVECFKNIQVDSIVLLSTLATNK